MVLPNIFESTEALEVYQAGETIFEEGQTGSTMYIVKEGSVSLLVHGKEVEVVEANSFFGEMALIETQVRSGSAVAKTACKLAPISQRQFIYMVDETPFFAITVMKKMSERLRRVDSHLN